MTEQHNVVVIGAGAAGLATAQALARAGRPPVVLERHALGHTRGSSHGRSRIVRLAHDRPDDVADALEAYELWDRLERDTATPMRITVGGLDFGGFVAPTARALDAHGVRYEHLSPTEIDERFAAIAAHGADALFQPDAAIGLPEAALPALARDAVAHGAQLRPDTPVTALELHDDHVLVETPAVTIEASAVVLAAGGWIAPLAAQAGIDLPARPTLQTAVQVRLTSAPVGAVPTVVEQLDDGRTFYSVPEPEGGLVKGGWHDPGPPVQLGGSRDPDPQNAAAYEDWARMRYRGVEARTDAYGCIYTRLPDDRFHLARHGRVIVASCCSGRGFKFIPRTGARAAALTLELF